MAIKVVTASERHLLAPNVGRPIAYVNLLEKIIPTRYKKIIKYSRISKTITNKSSQISRKFNGAFIVWKNSIGY